MITAAEALRIHAEATFAPQELAGPSAPCARSQPVRVEASFQVGRVLLEETVEAEHIGPAGDAVRCTMEVPDAADLLLIDAVVEGAPSAFAIQEQAPGHLHAGQTVQAYFAIKASVLRRIDPPPGFDNPPKSVTVRACLVLEAKEPTP